MAGVKQWLKPVLRRYRIQPGPIPGRKPIEAGFWLGADHRQQDLTKRRKTQRRCAGAVAQFFFGTENVPETRPPFDDPTGAPTADELPPARPSILDTPLARSITNRPPLSVSPPRRSATLPAMVIIRRLKS